MLDDMGFDSWQQQEIYLFCIMLRPAVGPTLYWELFSGSEVAGPLRSLTSI
jgi:hypothetical protein